MKCSGYVHRAITGTSEPKNSHQRSYMVEMFTKMYDRSFQKDFGIFERLGYSTSFKSSKKGNVRTYDGTQNFTTLFA